MTKKILSIALVLAAILPLSMRAQAPEDKALSSVVQAPEDKALSSVAQAPEDKAPSSVAQAPEDKDIRIVRAQAPEDKDFRILTPYDSTCREEIVQHLAEIKKHRPTVAVVLSGGGAKGAAHVGVLKELNKYGIPIDLIMGTSMGGLMGALYALGHSPEETIDLYAGIQWDQVMNDRIPYSMRTYNDKEYRDKFLLNVVFENNLMNDIQLGRVHGMQVNNLISALSVGYQDSTSFAKLPIPFICMASDVITGKEKAWYGGKITQAMRSTMAIPGVFSPVAAGDMLLLDGGMLNNMPADLARDLGADYIICVSLGDTQHVDDEYYHLGRFGFRLFTLGWARKYKKNYEIPNISIFPNVDGYGMLSFSREAIDTLLNRGAQEARTFDKEFRALKAEIGPDTLVLASKPAEQVITKKVKINEVEIKGVEGTEYNIVKHLAHIDGVKEIGGQRLAEVATNIYSTKAFDYVNFGFSGHEQPYKLILDCAKGPKNQFCFGLRMDTEEIISMIVRYGWHTRTLYGPGAVVTGKLGLNPYVNGKVYYRTAFGPVFNAEATAKWVNMGKIFTGRYSDMDFNYTNLRQELYMSESFDSPVKYKLGFRNDWLRLKQYYVYTDDDPVVEDAKNDMMSLFADVQRNTFDDAYFPTKGYRLAAGYQWMFHNSDNDIKNHVFTASATVPITIGERFTIMPTVMGRGVTGDIVPFSLNNYIGGAMFGRYFDQQLAFVGVPGISSTYQYMGVGRMDLRFRIGKSHYVSAIANGFVSCDSFDENKNTSKGFGAGVEYAYRTIAGPLRVQVGKSNVSRHWAINLSFGLDF